MRSYEFLLSRLHNWGACTPLTRLSSGNRHTVMLIERDGKRLVAKTTRRTSEAVSWLTPVFAQARAAGFIVPDLIPSLQGKLVVDGVTVELWLEGTPTSPYEREQALPLLKAFHETTRNVEQRPGFESSTALLKCREGGDVDLEAMPQDLVEICRAAWRELDSEPVSVVHGDLNAHNLLRTPKGHFALIDWDEARVDASILDEVALLPHKAPANRRLARAAKALEAWEVAVSWKVEPAYARRLAENLRGNADA